MAVSGLAYLFQAALPESEDKINTADCTGSWRRFGSTRQTQRFLLTKVNMISLQPARGWVKGCAALLATGESVQQQWQDVMPIFFLGNVYTWPASSAMTLCSWVNGPILVGGSTSTLFWSRRTKQSSTPGLRIELIPRPKSINILFFSWSQKLVQDVYVWITGYFLIQDVQRLCYFLLNSNLEGWSLGNCWKTLYDYVRLEIRPGMAEDDVKKG